MQIEWSEVAFEDLEGIRDYIARDAPFYADQFIDKLMSATEKLTEFPRVGRRVPETEGEGENIRELIFHSYRIMYQINQPEDIVLIVTVVHGSRDIAGRETMPWEIV